MLAIWGKTRAFAGVSPCCYQLRFIASADEKPIIQMAEHQRGRRYADSLSNDRKPMRTTRIHVEQPLALATELTLPAQATEHVARVLRMNAGDVLTVFNGDGFDYLATLVNVGKRDVVVRIDSREEIANESPLQLTLAQGVARGEKMDLIVQKATELGVARIVPLFTERSEVKLDAARAEKRLQHWRAVAASACEQSGRVRVPEVAPAQALQGWLESLADNDAQRLALLPEGTLRAREVPFGQAGGLLVVGPEGGLGDRDVTALREAGFLGLRLGPRILRTETAGLAALAALQALHGDL
jgi:16S rRNA (uracil1498-N3)-methyltransferase